MLLRSIKGLVSLATSNFYCLKSCTCFLQAICSLKPELPFLSVAVVPPGWAVAPQTFPVAALQCAPLAHRAVNAKPVFMGLVFPFVASGFHALNRMGRIQTKNKLYVTRPLLCSNLLKFLPCPDVLDIKSILSI